MCQIKGAEEKTRVKPIKPFCCLLIHKYQSVVQEEYKLQILNKKHTSIDKLKLNMSVQEYQSNNKYQILDMSKEKQELTVEQKTERFFKLVEAGDISLFQTFDQSIAMFGFTKVGKTSSCHILSNNSPLRAQNQNGDLIYRPTTLKYSSASVGLTTQSETQIPNTFQIRMREKNGTFKTIHLLDQPGYGDTYGFHRIFSNGYFHYRTFSKTPKLKFILAIKKAHLDDTGQKFRKTIQNFLSTFIRYDKIKGKIMGATSFLITQVDPKTTIENTMSLIKRLRNESVKSMTIQEKTRYQEFIDHMLENNKVFIIEKPDQVGTQTKETDILKQIYEKTRFWEREVKNGVVDMTEINFSCGGQILNELFSFKAKAVFKQEFDYFMKYTQDRINQILLNHPYSLKNIVQILKKDAVGAVESHTFLEGMVKFIQTFYKYDEQFRHKRQKTQANLFTLNQLNDSVETGKLGILNKEAAQLQQEYKEREMRQVYFIKKFKVLQFIKQRIDVIVFDLKLERSVYWLESISTYFIDLFRKFNILRIHKTDSQKIIYKYSYIIQRLIEQAKITTLILFSNEQLRKRFDQYKENMVDIFRPLKDKLFAQFGDIRVGEIKQEFMNRINLSNFDIVNKDIITFFESIKVDKRTRSKLAELVIKYAVSIKDKKNTKTEEKKFVIYKLFNYRNQFFDSMLEQKTKNQKDTSLQKIFVISNMMGHFLLQAQLYKEAREVFQSINNADQVFKIFETELSKTDKNAAKIRSLLIEYGKKAGYFHRQQLAMKCFQEAYSRSQTYQELKEVSFQIIELKKVKAKENQDPYLSRFFQENFCTPLSEGLKNTIELSYKGTSFFY